MGRTVGNGVTTLLLGTMWAAFFAFPGCTNRSVGVIEPRTQTEIHVSLDQRSITKLDLLFVIDNSGSMRQEQEELGRRVEDMIRELVTPTDRGSETPAPVTDLHLAVISTDIGSGGHRLGTCDQPASNDVGGDMGQMLGHQTVGSCAASFEPYASYDVESTDAPIWEQFGCVANLGTNGCGIEQPLESALMALTSQAENGRPNHGFLREDSLLAVVFVTDEDDCSVRDANLLDSGNGSLGPHTEMNQRCVRHRDLLHPVDRYIDALRDLRPNPDTLVVATIGGVPDDWSADPSLARLEGLIQENPANDGGFEPSCTSDFGWAVPPLRLVELTNAFGDNGVVQSICSSDWTPALQAIAAKIQALLPKQCVARRLPVPVTPDRCNVVETLTDERPCPGLAESESHDRAFGWHLDLGVTDGRRVCEVLPADADGDGMPDQGLEGWYYQLNQGENAEECPGEIFFTASAVSQTGSNVEIECLTSLCSERQACEMAVGDHCDPWVEGSCGEGETCATDGQAFRCTPTLGSYCGDENRAGASVPIVEAGCCHQGFHCEADINGAPQCVPNRTTDCDM